MVLKVNEPGILPVVDPPPQQVSDSALAGVTHWAFLTFGWIVRFLRRPEFPFVIFSRIEGGTLDETALKPQDGMLGYFAAGVVGGTEGMYLRENGVWKKL